MPPSIQEAIRAEVAARNKTRRGEFSLAVQEVQIMQAVASEIRRLLSQQSQDG